jgi:hypothetical protein
MKINDIKTVLSFQQVLESTSPQASDLLFESAAEMIRNIRTTFANGKNPVEAIGENWGVEHVAKFCAALEKIERVINKQISAGTIQSNLRDVVFSVLVTSDFDHATAIEKIVKQSHDQEERVNYWVELINSEDKIKLQTELDRVARDLSSLVSLMRTKGAEAVPPAKVEPEVKAAEPTL